MEQHSETLKPRCLLKVGVGKDLEMKRQSVKQFRQSRKRVAGLIHHHITVVARDDVQKFLAQDGRKKLDVGQLYAVEKQLRKQKAGPALRQTMRVWQSQPVMTRLHRAMELVRRKTLPQGLLGQAIDYTLKRWTALNQFITDGILEIDNNLIENSIRPSALGKRNWMFIGHPEAGERSAVIYSLLGSCRRLGINPFDYLKDLFTRLPAAKITQIKQFTPAMWVRARTGASQPAQQNLP